MLKNFLRTISFLMSRTHNCCNFAEEALQACGLEHCYDLGKSSGLDRKNGPLEK